MNINDLQSNLSLLCQYLGVVYNKKLTPELAFERFQPKIKYIYNRLYRLLCKSDLRTRYNIWQIFVMPLIRMTISIIGIKNSHRLKKLSQIIKKQTRKTLKQFMQLPKSAPNEIIDKLGNHSTGRIYEIIGGWNKVLCDRGQYEINDEDFAKIEISEQNKSEPFKTFNPQLGDILGVINRYECKTHKTRLTIRHIRKCHRNLNIDDNGNLFTTWKNKDKDQRKDNSKFKRFNRYLKQITGKQLFKTYSFNRQGRVN